MKKASKELINLALELSHKSHDNDINCTIILGKNVFINGTFKDNLEGISEAIKDISKYMKGNK